MKTDAKREEILIAASEIFSEKGFHEAKIGDISARLGASKATIYNYFSSKNDLFWATIARQAAPVMSEITSRLEGNGPFRARLIDFCSSYICLFTAPATISIQRLMISEAGRSQGASILREAASDKEWEQVSLRLAHAQKEGALRGGDSAGMGKQLKALIEGGLPLEQLYEDKGIPRETIDAAAVEIADFFLHACGPR